MTTQTLGGRLVWAGLLCSAALVFVALGAVIGCQATAPSAASSDSAGAATQPAELAAAKPAKSGAQLWAEDCGHCHNLRSPSSYSAVQWDMIVMHMQMRANLPGEDAKAISQFLQASTH